MLLQLTELELITSHLSTSEVKNLYVIRPNRTVVNSSGTYCTRVSLSNSVQDFMASKTISSDLTFNSSSRNIALNS